MGIEALWAVQFTGARGLSARKSGGVLIFETGRIFGGDTWQWYTGSYNRDPKTGRITCRIQSGVHFTECGESIFGGLLRAQVLIGEINVADDQKTATARLIDEADPQTTLNATLAWVDRLP